MVEIKSWSLFSKGGSPGSTQAGSGLPVPSRRTLPAAILAFGRSVPARFGILPSLAAKAGSIGTGNPEQSVDALVQRWLPERARTRPPGGAAGGPPRLQGAGMPLQPYSQMAWATLSLRH
jgi:hypothetical protein